MPEPSGLPWESLVTDGHVRAARLRAVQPALITLAIFAVLLGFYLALIVREKTAGGYVPAMQAGGDPGAPVRAAVAGLPPLQVLPAEGRTLAPFKQIGEAVIPALLDELNRSGRLGTQAIHVASLSTEDFWRKPWPHDALVSTGEGDVRLVGAVANQGSAYYVNGTRWLGVFSKRHGEWRFLSAAMPGFSIAAGQPATPLENIPLTLKPVLPAEE